MAERRIRHEGFGFLDLAPACSRRLRPIAYEVLASLSEQGGAICFNPSTGTYHTNTGERVHSRTVDALVGSALVVRVPSSATPEYRVSARGEYVLSSLNKLAVAQPAPSSSQQCDASDERTNSIGSDDQIAR